MHNNFFLFLICGGRGPTNRTYMSTLMNNESESHRPCLKGRPHSYSILLEGRGSLQDVTALLAAVITHSHLTGTRVVSKNTLPIFSQLPLFCNAREINCRLYKGVLNPFLSIIIIGVDSKFQDRVSGIPRHTEVFFFSCFCEREIIQKGPISSTCLHHHKHFLFSVVQRSHMQPE